MMMRSPGRASSEALVAGFLLLAPCAELVLAVALPAEVLLAVGLAVVFLALVFLAVILLAGTVWTPCH
jgi:hypothetical protein